MWTGLSNVWATTGYQSKLMNGRWEDFAGYQGRHGKRMEKYRYKRPEVVGTHLARSGSNR